MEKFLALNQYGKNVVSNGQIKFNFDFQIIQTK